MSKRKIQLVGGSSFSISLPKEWIRQNNLKPKDEVSIELTSDKKLIISANPKEKTKFDEVLIDAEKNLHIDQLIFANYYLGVNTIKIFSKNKIKSDVKTSIMKAVNELTGMEIIYEDEKNVMIKMLLDKTKININQIIYRILIIINQSIENINENFDINEIKINENAVDKLYHMANSILNCSLFDSEILDNSNIKNVFLIPQYIFILKKLESIHDNIMKISGQLEKNPKDLELIKNNLTIFKDEINKTIRSLIKGAKFEFDLKKDEDIKMDLSKFDEKSIFFVLKDMIKHLIDIKETLVIFNYYRDMKN
ncbi:MAG: AbrB/MazE/SpoVT family DNA-binding domain-containing protein [Candidatus Aenigmarchaeota archaeon]|nr:AbrB/MazE/SpoVT family DNA-binding domain-containing protein [Candidatus Aenigmarchaeota archaeon]